MDDMQGQKQKETELVDTANAVLNGELDVLEGVRRICALRFDVADPENELFIPFHGIDSQMDWYPVETARSHWAPDALSRLDAEKEAYMQEAKPLILQCCREIVHAFS